MIDIDIHKYSDQLKLRRLDSGVEIFDIIRKKYLVLQPEEIVRQLSVLHLISIGYAKEKIQVEKALEVNGLKRRFDIVVYDEAIAPYILVECKSHKVRITQDTFDQVVRYNMTMKAPYILVTNGVQTFCAKLEANGNYEMLDKLPIL